MEGGRADREVLWRRLMTAAQDGDGDAYGRLLRACAPFIRSMARRRFADPDQAEDVVQDVLLCVHRVRQTYDPGRAFTPWLAAITERRCVDALRRKLRVAAREANDDHAYETFADPVANKAMEAGDGVQEVGALLAGLPPGQRQALELVKLKEMSLAEASAVSGQSIGALKVAVHRAIRTLRTRLGRAE